MLHILKATNQKTPLRELFSSRRKGVYNDVTDTCFMSQVFCPNHLSNVRQCSAFARLRAERRKHCALKAALANEERRDIRLYLAVGQ